MEDPYPIKRDQQSPERGGRLSPFAALTTLPELPGVIAMAAKLENEHNSECYPFAVHEQSLRDLRQLVRAVRNPNLNRFLCDVFREPEFRRWILIDRCERPSTVLPRMGAAAQRAYGLVAIDTYAKETLYCATLVARLSEVLDQRVLVLGPTGGIWSDHAKTYLQHMSACILKLEACDAYAAWVMRMAIGLPNDDPLRSVEAAGLMTRVHLAWIQTLAADAQLRMHPCVPYQS